MGKKQFIYLIILAFLIVLSYLGFKRLRSKQEILPGEKAPTITLYPIWTPRPEAVKPTITYEKFPFSPSDKTRKVEIVGCVIDDSEWGMSYPKKVVEISNVSAVATETIKAFLKEAAETGWGGFPTKNEVESFFGYAGETILKKLTIDKFGTTRVYFSKEVQAYGGGSGRVACMHDSVELTLKQFTNVKNVIMCIEDICADQKGSAVFQP